MENVSWEKVRNLLLDIHTVDHEGIEFDTDRAVELGYTSKEINAAETIITTNNNWSLRAEEIREQIIMLCFWKAIKPVIYYLNDVKLIFIFDISLGIYSYMFEEELEDKMRKVDAEAFDNYLDYVLNNFCNDAFGNEILTMPIPQATRCCKCCN